MHELAPWSCPASLGCFHQPPVRAKTWNSLARSTSNNLPWYCCHVPDDVTITVKMCLMILHLKDSGATVAAPLRVKEQSTWPLRSKTVTELQLHSTCRQLYAASVGYACASPNRLRDHLTSSVSWVIRKFIQYWMGYSKQRMVTMLLLVASSSRSARY
jgi:hypothetical protein